MRRCAKTVLAPVRGQAGLEGDQPKVEEVLLKQETDVVVRKHTSQRKLLVQGHKAELVKEAREVGCSKHFGAEACEEPPAVAPLRVLTAEVLLWLVASEQREAVEPSSLVRDVPVRLQPDTYMRRYTLLAVESELTSAGGGSGWL